MKLNTEPYLKVQNMKYLPTFIRETVVRSDLPGILPIEDKVHHKIECENNDGTLKLK